MSQTVVHDKDAIEMGPGETVGGFSGGAVCGEGRGSVDRDTVWKLS